MEQSKHTRTMMHFLFVYLKRLCCYCTE